jgi:hypothetical protein
MKKAAFYCFSSVLFSAVMLMTSCGSSGSGSPSAATTTVSGEVFMGPVGGASVTVKDANGNIIAGPVKTSTDGTYTVNVPSSSLNADLLFVSTDGTYDDEASGATTTANTLMAYVSGGTLTTGLVNIDPSTTIICDLVTKFGKSDGEAQTIFNNAFGYLPNISIESKNIPSTGASVAERLAALRAGAFSQLTKDLGLTPDQQCDLIEAISKDLADGTLDGHDGSDVVSVGTTALPDDMQNIFIQSLVTFLSSTANLTELTPDLIAPLPFAKVALTDTYRVEYVPGMMAATQGKTSFSIKITKRSDGTPATGLTVSLMPMMHMSTMGHSAPVDVVSENPAGTYNCTIYYLMASGSGMGFWDLKVMISGGMGMGESATFYPSVAMAMGSDTVRTMLFGSDDIVSSMSGTQYNKYYLFRDGPVSASASTLDLFIAHSENMMMDFVPVSLGSVLSSPTGNITAMTVQASMDNSFTSPLSAVDNGNGHWSVTGLTGLVSGQTSTIYVKLNVNSQDKTTDGKAPFGVNGYATFLVTPGM